MAFTICVAQRKGGAGKTTLCCHLAAAFRDQGLAVGLIDTDEQASLLSWAQLRRARAEDRGVEADIGYAAASGYTVPSAVRRFRQMDVVIIDTPPSTDAVVARAMSAADLILAPLQLSPLDLDASLPTARMIGRTRRPALFVVNRTPPRARIADKIRAEIVQHDLPVAEVELGARAAFAEALATGRGVTEAFPSSIAATEARALAAQLIGGGDAAAAA